MNWTELKGENLLDWMYGFPKKVLPGAYRLATPTEVQSLVRSSQFKGIRSQVRYRAGVRPDSGALEIDFDLPAAEEIVTTGDIDRIQQVALGMARIVDSRLYGPVQVAERDERGVLSRQRAVIYEASSRIEEGLGEIDVIGPGGRVTVYWISNRVTADLTIRRRQPAEMKPRSWRDFREIGGMVLRELQNGPPDLRLRVAFGYFEASKYDAQDWLRMAFAFSIDLPIAPADAPRSSVLFVEAATD